MNIKNLATYDNLRNIEYRDQLLPCPFCGSTDLDESRLRSQDYREGPTVYRLSIFCKSCGGHAGKSIYIETAVEKWNNRA